MGRISLTYRRPGYVDKEEFRQRETSTEFDDKRDASMESGRSGASSGIPDALTFDKIMNGGTCPVSWCELLFTVTLADRICSPAPSGIS